MAGAIYSTSKLWKARVQVTPDTSGNMVSVVPSAPTPAPTPLDPAQAPAQDPAQAAAQDPAQAPAQDPDEAPAQVPRVPSAPDQAPDQDPAKAPCPTKSWTSTQAPAQFQGYRPIQLQKDKVNSQNEVVASAQKRDREVVAVPVSELPGVVTSSQNYSQLPKVAQEDGKISKHAPTPAGNQESRIQASQGAGAESLAEPVSCQPKQVDYIGDLPDEIENMQVKSVGNSSEELVSASVEAAALHHRHWTTTEGRGHSLALENIADSLHPFAYLERGANLQGMEEESSCSESEAESSCVEMVAESSFSSSEPPASHAEYPLVAAAAAGLAAGNRDAISLRGGTDSPGTLLSFDSVWHSNSFLYLSSSVFESNDDTGASRSLTRNTGSQTAVTHQRDIADCLECRTARPPNHFVPKNSKLKAMEGTWQLVAGRTHCGFEVINITIGVAAVILFDRLGVSYGLSIGEQRNVLLSALGSVELREGKLYFRKGVYRKRPCDLQLNSPDCNSQDSFLASGCRPAHLDTGGQHSMKSSSIQTDSWMVLDGFSPDWAVCCRSRCCLQCAGLNALSHQALDFGVLDGFWQLQADQHNDEDDYRYLRVVGRWVIANNGTWNYLRDSCGQVLLQNCVLGHRHASLCWFRKTRRKLYCRATLADREKDCHFAAFDMVTRSALATLSSSTVFSQATRTYASLLGIWNVMPEHRHLANAKYASLCVMSDKRQRTSKSKSASKHAYKVYNAFGDRCTLKVYKKRPTTLNGNPIWWDEARLLWLSSNGQLMIYDNVK
eukprot:TRINITY_DN9707_c1_g1_i3.p1 TRINITY_DN9707_c1_g1~~TRINITY_DN9707_c1_g1_i3.p1  ORF type:complete len:847 (-),score=107.03 TRINITY_DN9707_c1_g1_i3:24-2363(-)